MPYPSGLDFLNYLKSLKIVDESEPMNEYYNQVMQDVIAGFEFNTGWVPFLNEGGFEEKLFTLKSTNVFVIPSGAIAIEHVKYDGELLEEGNDYVVEPLNATPKRRLLFKRYMPIKLNALEIKLKPGYTNVLPANVRGALLGRATVKFFEDRQKDTGDLASVRQGEVAYSYSDSSANENRMRIYERVVANYRRHLYA